MRAGKGEQGEDTGNKLAIVLLPYNGRPLDASIFTYPQIVFRLPPSLFVVSLPPPSPSSSVFVSLSSLLNLRLYRLKIITFVSVLSLRTCTETEYLECP